jgi:hypothetical protein
VTSLLILIELQPGETTLTEERTVFNMLSPPLSSLVCSPNTLDSDWSPARTTKVNVPSIPKWTSLQYLSLSLCNHSTSTVNVVPASMSLSRHYRFELLLLQVESLGSVNSTSSIPSLSITDSFCQSFVQCLWIPRTQFISPSRRTQTSADCF